MELSGILTVYLSGELNGPTKDVNTQRHTVMLSHPKNSAYKRYRDVAMSKDILHTDRVPQSCERITRIAPEAIAYWLGNSPHHIKPQQWRAMNRDQKLEAHAIQFDEGHGVTFELIN